MKRSPNGSYNVTGSHWFEDPETYLKLSPSTYAQNVTTPLLIVHSEDDLRCPVVNAEELFSILRILGREVEFVRFPHGEGHELSRSGTPLHRVQRFEILVDWFDRAGLSCACGVSVNETTASAPARHTLARKCSGRSGFDIRMRIRTSSPRARCASVQAESASSPATAPSSGLRPR